MNKISVAVNVARNASLLPFQFQKCNLAFDSYSNEIYLILNGGRNDRTLCHCNQHPVEVILFALSIKCNVSGGKNNMYLSCGSTEYCDVTEYCIYSCFIIYCTRDKSRKVSDKFAIGRI